MNAPAPGFKASALLAYLSAHIGRDKGVSARDVARWINWSEREVRKYVSELREHGHPVCGTPRSGYYLAATEEEWQETDAFLYARAMHTLRRLAQVRKISLPDLLGQLRLKT